MFKFMRVGRNYRTPLATILTHSYRLVHIHTSDHTRTPVTSTTHLTFLINRIRVVKLLGGSMKTNAPCNFPFVTRTCLQHR